MGKECWSEVAVIVRRINRTEAAYPPRQPKAIELRGRRIGCLSWVTFYRSILSLEIRMLLSTSRLRTAAASRSLLVASRFLAPLRPPRGFLEVQGDHCFRLCQCPGGRRLR